MATIMATGPMKMAPRTDGIIEATAPEAEPKLSSEVGHVGYVERKYGLEARTKRGVTFEEYRHWAKIERQLEREENRQYIADRGPATVTSVIKGRFSKGVHHENAKKEKQLTNEKTEPASEQSSQVANPESHNTEVTDDEWRTAARALRTASWGTIFYVMTTDILGFQSTPSVFASVGYGPGAALYVIFALAAGASGWMIWRTFLGLDSSRYPMLSFGDPFFRLFGPRARHFINVTQSIQMFFNVAVLLLGQSQILYQVAENKICFVACMIIIMVVGMLSGSIRSLQRLGWLCNASVWINVISFIIIIAAAATHAPEYSVVNSLTLIKTQGNIKTFVGPPPVEYQQQSTNEFAAQFNGVDAMVYSYSGAVLFIAFLAEMRQPFDFWKGMIIAQSFICVIYTIFGAVVYNYYGQYSYSSITQVLQPHGIQIAGNVLNLITGFIAIFLYFNIGMKTVYLEVGQELLRAPPIITRKGRVLWYLTGPFYWIIALVVSASVPNFNGISNFVGGLFGVNFTYSLPGIMYAAYKIQCGAKLDGEGFNPETGATVRHDRGVKRWIRGYRKTFVPSSLAILFSLAGLATSGMGTWAAIEGLIATLGPGGQIATSWSCKALS